jgi:Holliday junction resolvase RusA-like endonuclease
MSKIEVTFTVIGDPASQGSHSIINGRIVQVNSSKLNRWRKAVIEAAQEHLPQDWQPLDGPVELIVNFYMSKPASVKRSLPTVAPDLDKLIRGVGDALTMAGVVTDDSRIVRISARKIYAAHMESGATIQISTLE